MNKIAVVICFLIIFSGCEKVIDINDLDINENQSTIVIEGNVTDEAGPYFVKITRSIFLSDVASNPTVDDAEVSITDNEGTTDVLTPVGNGLYRTNVLIGKPGNTYKLTAKVGDATYIAESTMPETVTLDDIQFNEVAFGGDVTHDVIPVYNDPATIGNAFRFILTVNDSLIKQQFLINDLVVNGKRNDEHLQQLEIELMQGDSIKLIMQHIDQAVGLYYSTLIQIAGSGPGGGTTPNNPPSNISNGALGIFSAHTIQRKTVVFE